MWAPASTEIFQVGHTMLDCFCFGGRRVFVVEVHKEIWRKYLWLIFFFTSSPDIFKTIYLLSACMIEQEPVEPLIRKEDRGTLSVIPRSHTVGERKKRIHPVLKERYHRFTDTKKKNNKDQKSNHLLQQQIQQNNSDSELNLTDTHRYTHQCRGPKQKSKYVLRVKLHFVICIHQHSEGLCQCGVYP